MLFGLYRFGTRLAAPVLLAMLARRVRRGKEVAARLGERRGIDTTARPAGRLLWVHAASMGETLSVLPVLRELAKMVPAAHVLLTTGTVTSAELLARRLPEMGLDAYVTHRFVPLDVPGWVARFLDHWRPDVAGFVESEIWPNLLMGCAERQIPVMRINAKMSVRSYAQWRRVRRSAARLFGVFDAIQAQSAVDDARLRMLGAVPASLVGNLKFAADELPVDMAELARLKALLAARPVWLAAQTHPGEEEAAFAVHVELVKEFPDLLSIVVPRHPMRGEEIAGQASGIAVTRRGAGEDPPPGPGVWLADTLGELGLFYRLAGLGFVGGSLAKLGGHNPLEPARLGCAVAIGPSIKNCVEAVTALADAGALCEVADTAELTAWVRGMLRDPAARQEMGARGVAVARGVRDLPGQTAEIFANLMRVVEKP